MKTDSKRIIWLLLVVVLVMAARSVRALGSDYPNDRPITGSTSWPKGLEKLINITNRVHGFFVNAEDAFFFSGSASQLTAFLREFSQLEGIENRRLVLHDGLGEAKSPWDKTGHPCDWKLYVCPKAWHTRAVLSRQGTNSVEATRAAAQESGYIAEVHFWTGGRIAFDQVDVPKNVEVKKER
jgi:hypothetical protein